MPQTWRLAAVLAVCCVLLAGIVSSSLGKEKPNLKMVKRGEYLVNAIGCGDCHTPMKMGPKGPEPDMTRLLSGHPKEMTLPASPITGPGPWMAAVSASFTAWAGPWGVSYTRNLTPDKETGLGDWTELNFIQTIRNGKRQGKGRDLLPPMPWQALRNLNDDDLKSIFAYLKTIPVVSNAVPEPIPPAGQPAPGK
jgi:cytochrome c553